MGKISESKSWYVIELFASLFMIALMVVLLIGSFNYWADNYPDLRDLNSQLFYIAVGVAIVTSIGQWIQGRLDSIIKRRQERIWLKKKSKK